MISCQEISRIFRDLSIPYTVPFIDTHPPTGLTVTRINSTTIRVSWTPPEYDVNVIGYRIYYEAEGNQSFVDVDGSSTTERTLTNLQTGVVYSISIASRGAFLSVVVGTVIVPAGKYIIL